MCLLLIAIFSSYCIDSYALRPRPKPFKSPEEAAIYFNCHYAKGCHYFQREEWRSAAKEFEKVTFFDPNADAVADAHFFLGVSFYHMGEYDFANHEFTSYLKTSQHPTHFGEAIDFKFCIAEAFKAGAQRRLFTLRYCPKCVSAREMAVTIYDEIITAVPNGELTVQALFSKGCLLINMGEYKDSVDAFQTIIRRFPKHEIIPSAYLNVAQAYYHQAKREFQNPDILAFAELNARKFREEFPRESKLEIADEYVKRIKEMYARGLTDLGLFYERTGKPTAAVIYYRSAIEEFPETNYANFARDRLRVLGIEIGDDEQ